MAAFTPGNIVVYRVGTGAAALGSTATAVFLDEYTTAGTLVQSIAMPTSDAGAQQTLTASGSATSEGLLTRSADGRYILLAGYDAALATASVASAAGISRVVARVGADGTVDTSTTLGTSLAGNNIRGVTSTNGTDIWASGGVGIAYTTFGSTADATVLAAQNTRMISVFDGQLYMSTSSGSSVRVGAVGTGTPTTTGQTITSLPGVPTTGGSPYGYFLADLSAAVAGVDTLYVADDGLGQILKYTFNGTTWATDGTVTAAGIRGLAGSVSGGTVSLFASAAGTLFSFTDSTGYDGTVSGTATSIATAATNTAFRGVAFAPVAPPLPTLSLNDVTHTEGNAGTTTYSFTVSLSAPAPAGGVTFDIATANGTATTADSDYVSRSLVSQTIAAGQSTYTFDVTVNGDAAAEASETFFVNVTNVVGATLADGQGVGTITDDDTVLPPTQTIAFTAGSLAISKPEIDTGNVTYTFTINRTGGTTGAVTVTGNFVAGTGVDAADFGGVLPTFSATIADGQASTTFSVLVSGDDVIEGDETFTVTLTGGTNSGGAPIVVGANAAATGTIMNDDAAQSIGGINVYEAAPSLEGDATPPALTDDVVLVRLGAFTGSGSTLAGRAESVTFDPINHRIYVTNAAQDLIDVAQVNADGSTTPLASLDLTAMPGIGTINSVAVKGDVIAVAFDNATAGQPGYVALYNGAGSLLNTIQVGVIPDQLTFTPDGLRLLVANEAEAVSAANNPAGSISIIHLTDGPALATISTIDFSALNGFETELAARGVALFPGQAAANDIEPEYITVSPDGTRAYVTLQEVNAVAVIDLTAPGGSLIALQPLGGVDHNLLGNAFDPTDTGSAISIGNFDVISLLQPDAIASFEVGGVTYFITANEGDARVGTGIEGLDVVRVNTSYTMDPTAYPTAAALEANGQLGRLNVLTNVGDTDFDGDYDQVYGFGGRGVSIFRQEADGSITKVRETGGEFEAILARDYAAYFNTNQATGTVDSRSDDKGPEPEGVAVGQVGDRTYAFVTLERSGGVMVYDVTDPANATFVTYRPSTGAIFGPETVSFVSAANSPTGGALLLTADEIAGTTTIYRVVRQTENADVIEGSPDADTFKARAGNDTLTGFGGNDSLDGGADTDTAVYRGNRADYAISDNGDGSYRIIDARPGSPAGTDTVRNVELFQFADGTVAVANLLAVSSAGTITISDAQVLEGNSGTVLLTMTVSRSGGTGAFAVDFATANGGAANHAAATAGSDYVAASGTLVFAAGQDVATISITVNGDTLAELSEELTVTLSNATTGAVIADAQGIGTITTDDILTNAPANAWINEFHYDNNGTDTGEFIEIAGAAGTDLSEYSIVRYNGAVPGAAVPYTTPAQTTVLTGTIPNQGGTGFGTFTVNFPQDGLQNGTADGFALVRTVGGVPTVVEFWSYEGVMTASTGVAAGMTSIDVGVAELGTANGTSIVRTSGPAGATWALAETASPGAINPAQTLPAGGTAVPGIAVSDVVVSESAGTVTLTITRTNVAEGAFSVNYSTANGTATTADGDYTQASGTLNFAANQTQAQVVVNIGSDAKPELDETFFLNLSDATNGAVITDAQAQVTIQNDDGTPIQVAIGDASIAEGDAGTKLLTFTVTRSGASDAFSVGFETANGSATSGSDYDQASGTLTFASGVNTQTFTVTINGDTLAENNETFVVSLVNPTNNAVIVDGQGTGTIVNDDITYIHDIQGSAYYSPILVSDGITNFNVASTSTVTVRAVVTAVDNVGTRQGYYLSEEVTDWDGNSYTSEGIFVMTRDDNNVGTVVSGVTVGDLVQISANVMEYQAFASMPRTVLVNSTGLSIVSQNNDLPTVTLTGIPNAILTVENPDYFDSSDDIGDTFDAARYALSYFETVEGMLVTVPNMIVADGFVSLSGGRPYLQAYSLDSANPEQINSRGGYTIAGDPPLGPPNTPSTDDDTVNGGAVLHDGDVNPDVIELDFTDFAVAPPADLVTDASMGDKLGDVTGIIDFDFTDRKLFVTKLEAGGQDFSGQPAQEVTVLGDDSRSLTVATFNVENLDPTDGAARFTALANAIANNLNSPDIISVEEIQDNNGAAAGGVGGASATDASTTWQMLVDALNLVTGAHYQWVDQEPVSNAEGGEQQGNIRVGFLYNTDRVQLGDLAADASLEDRRKYTDRIGDGVRDAGDLIAFSDDMAGVEINTADWAGTRRSLLGEFTFNGNKVYVTANHWPSKGGSGQFYQLDQSGGDPINGAWEKRNAIAQDVYTMLDLIQQNDSDAGVIAGGDFNDFYFYRPLTTVTGYTHADGTARIGGSRFENLTLTLDEAERYTYAFDGRTQAIDHIIVNGLLGDVATYDVVHINTGYNSRGTDPALSDHDPALSSFDFRDFDEVLTGRGVVDIIDGFGGNDRITGLGGNDVLDGGEGKDTAVFRGNRADYAISVAGGVITVQDLRNGSPDGTDQLTNFELLEFADGTLELNDAPVVTIDTGIGKLGNEIRVNTATDQDQHHPRMAALTGGGFVVVWEDMSQSVGGAQGDNNYSAVKAQVFSASGAPVGSEILVNTAIAFYQWHPTVTALSNGGFVVAWDDTSEQQTNGSDVRAQAFTSTGAKSGTEIEVATGLNEEFQSDITALAGGRFVVTWTENRGDNGGGTYDDAAIKGQLFEANGTPVAPSFRVNHEIEGDQRNSQVTTLSNGGFAVTWGTHVSAVYDDETFEEIAPAHIILGVRIFDANGTPGPETLLADVTSGDDKLPQITALASGFVVTWTDKSTNNDGSGSSVRAQLFDAAGAASGGIILVNTATAGDQYDPRITTLSDGRFVITWTDNSLGVGGATGDDINDAIKAQIFEANGTPAGGEILVNSTILYSQVESKVAALPNGGFMVTWSDNSASGDDTSSQAVRAQAFDASGEPIGEELLVNTATANQQNEAQIVSLTGGGIAIAWADQSFGVGGATGDTSRYAIKAQVFGEGTLAAIEQVPLDIKGITSVDDEDADGGTLRATLAVTYGTLTLTAGDSGASIISGNGTGSVVVEGTIKAINGLLGDFSTSTVLYSANTDNPPATATLTVTVNDQGNTGVGGAKSGSDSVIINITPVNDAPSGSDGAVNGSENDPYVFTTANFAFTDPENNALLAVKIASLPTKGTLLYDADGAGAGAPVPVLLNQTITAADIAAGKLSFKPADSTSGSPYATFTFQVQDNGGGTDIDLSPNTLTVNIVPDNAPPIAVDDTLAATEDTPATFTAAQLLDNDVDPNGDALVITAVASQTGGTVVKNADGSVTFTPTANFNGKAAFEYTISDGKGGSDVGAVTVNVAAVNDAPTVPAKNTVTTNEDVASNGVTIGAGDVDGDVLSYTVKTGAGPAKGVVTFSGDKFTYTPTANANGADAFTIVVSDGKGGTAEQAVTVTITPVNDAPVAVDDTVAATEDTLATFTAAQLLGNDTDIDGGDTLVISAVSGSTGGIASLNADGSVSFAPLPNFNGVAGFDYTVSDGKGGSDVGHVTVNVAAVNDAPTAPASKAITTLEDAPSKATVIGASDIDGDTLTYSVKPGAAPAKGSVSFADGRFVYTPTANANGSDAFTILVSDGKGGTAEQQVSVTITPVNDVPVAVDDVLTTNEDTQAVFTKAQIVGNDTDVDGDTLSVTSVLGATGGTALRNSDGSVTFTPAANYNGTGGFDYVVSDGKGGFDVGHATVNILPVNDAPTAPAKNSVTTDEDTASVAVAIGAADLEGDTLSYVVKDGFGPAKGSVSFAGGKFVYTPGANLNGSDAFTILISDGHGGTAEQVVSVSITPVSDPTVAVDDLLAATEDTVVTYPPSALVGNDTDVDGTALTVTAVSNVTGGTAVRNANGSVTFTPTANFHGTAGFDYTASDGKSSDTGHATIIVEAVNDAPILANAIPDQTSPEDAPWIYQLPAEAFSDVDGDVLTYTAQLANGSDLPAWLSFNSATRTFSGTPTANFNGNVNIRVTASDGTLTASDIFQLNVTPVNDAPIVANPIADQSSAEDAPWSFVVPANAFTDIDNASLTYAAALGSGGVLPAWLTFDAATRSFTGTPPANFNGNLDLRITASDGSLSVSDTFRLTITPVNDAPTTAESQSVSAIKDTSRLVTVIAADVDGDTLSYTASKAANGTVTGGAGGKFNYTPGAGFVGDDSFTVTVADGHGGTDTQTVTVTVFETLADGWRLFAEDGFAGEIGGSGTVFGTNQFQEISVLDLAGKVTFDPSFNRGGDRIVLEGNASAWSIVRSGSSAVLSDGDTTISLPAGGTGTEIVFDDGARSLKIVGSDIALGTQVATSVLTPVTAAAAAPLTTVADVDAAGRIFLMEGGSVFAGGNLSIFGTNGAEEVTLTRGNIDLDPSFNRGGDTLRLIADADTFSAVRVGSSVMLDGAEVDVLIPVGSIGMKLAFGDDERTLVYVEATNSLLIGTQVIGLTAAPLSEFA